MSHYARYAPAEHGDAIEPLEVRGARLADAPAIARIGAERDGEATERMTPRVAADLERIAAGDPHRYTAVAVVDGDVVGFARCLYTPPDDAERGALVPGWCLAGVVVASRWRRRGVGAALTRHRLDWLRQRTTHVTYWVDEINRASIALHERFGFELVQSGVLVSAYRNRNPQSIFRLSFD